MRLNNIDEGFKKLNGANYDQWKRVMRNRLREKGLWSVVADGLLDKPEPQNGDYLRDLSRQARIADSEADGICGQALGI